MVSFYEVAITPGCRQGLEYLRHQAFIRDFYLAGGTALALQMGHRISTDLDWFSAQRRLFAPEREEICLILSLNPPSHTRGYSLLQPLTLG